MHRKVAGHSESSNPSKLLIARVKSKIKEYQESRQLEYLREAKSILESQFNRKEMADYSIYYEYACFLRSFAPVFYPKDHESRIISAFKDALKIAIEAEQKRTTSHLIYYLAKYYFDLEKNNPTLEDVCLDDFIHYQARASHLFQVYRDYVNSSGKDEKNVVENLLEVKTPNLFIIYVLVCYILQGNSDVLKYRRQAFDHVIKACKMLEDVSNAHPRKEKLLSIFSNLFLRLAEKAQLRDDAGSREMDLVKKCYDGALKANPNNIAAYTCLIHYYRQGQDRMNQINFPALIDIIKEKFNRLDGLFLEQATFINELIEFNFKELEETIQGFVNQYRNKLILFYMQPSYKVDYRDAEDAIKKIKDINVNLMGPVYEKLLNEMINRQDGKDKDFTLYKQAAQASKDTSAFLKLADYYTNEIDSKLERTDCFRQILLIETDMQSSYCKAAKKGLLSIALDCKSEIESEVVGKEAAKLFCEYFFSDKHGIRSLKEKGFLREIDVSIANARRFMAEATSKKAFNQYLDVSRLFNLSYARKALKTFFIALNQAKKTSDYEIIFIGIFSIHYQYAELRNEIKEKLSEVFKNKVLKDLVLAEMQKTLIEMDHPLFYQLFLEKEMSNPNEKEKSDEKSKEGKSAEKIAEEKNAEDVLIFSDDVDLTEWSLLGNLSVKNPILHESGDKKGKEKEEEKSLSNIRK